MQGFVAFKLESQYFLQRPFILWFGNKASDQTAQFASRIGPSLPILGIRALFSFIYYLFKCFEGNGCIYGRGNT